MQQVGTALPFEEMLSAERPRLVRLCARLSGSVEAAEDLAQETLLTAWRHADRLQTPDEPARWLSSIARNVCLNWSRGYYRERSRVVHLESARNETTGIFSDEPRADFDLEVELERGELATLLDRAMALLPVETRSALIQHYIEETSHAEIAANLGLSEGAVAVRLHRGKLALRRVLTSNLSEEMAAYRPAVQEDGWEQTRIWCPSCAQHRLMGWFDRGSPSGKFMLRCPSCNGVAYMSGADLSLPFWAEALAGVKAFKPAFSRLMAAASDYTRQALAAGRTKCLACGRESAVPRIQQYGKEISPETADNYQAIIECTACGWAANNSLWSHAMVLPETQRFWRDHPRLSSLPAREIEVEGSPGLVMRLYSATATGGLDVVFLRDTFRVIGVHTTPHT